MRPIWITVALAGLIFLIVSQVSIRNIGPSNSTVFGTVVSLLAVLLGVLYGTHKSKI